MNLDTILATTSAFTTLAVWVAYMGRVPSGKVPARPVGSIGAQLVALVTGLWAVVWFPSGLVIGLSSVGIIMSALFLWLLTQRKTPVGNITVRVGDHLPAFEARTDAGAPFSTDEFRGQRVLLKFFRGHW